ncbi:MAG: PaaI family thioesterase [Litoreibacter sp.]|nr:PaaI family thioesterase [Litoreibacter sp.]
MSDVFFAESSAELPNRDQVLSLSGYDFMRGILEGRLPSAPIAQTLGFQLHAVEDGSVTFRGAPGFNQMNPVGTVHGGWYATILDSALACAVMTKVPKGSLYTTLELKVNIVRPIPDGCTVDCTGIVQHAGRSTGISIGEIRGVEDDKLYATGSTTCMIMTP